MRLTLRTLLAYLDDTLDPTPAKEIGQKLTETPAAQELVSRIREVTRRRRVTAPAIVGDEVDPNVVAEYLDNLLAPEAVAHLEAHCLDSDVHLAEVAACHQILTLIGQPAGINDSMRRRMYQLVHAIESIPADRRAGPVVAQRVSPPSMFSQRPLLARVLSAAAILLGTVGITWLVWVSLPPNRDAAAVADRRAVESDEVDGHFIPKKRGPIAADPSLPADESAMPDANASDALPELDSDRAVEAAGRDSDSPDPEMPQTDSPDDAPPAAQPAKEQPESDPARGTNDSDRPVGRPAEAPKNPADEKPMEAATKPGEPPNPNQPPATTRPETNAEPAAKPPPVVAHYAATSGVLLKAEESNRDWRRIQFRSEIHDSDRLLSLPLYRATLQGPTGAQVELVGETELMFVQPTDGVDMHLKVDRGRVVLGTNQDSAVFQIDFLDQSWRVVLSAPEHSVGFSLTPVWRPGGPFVTEAAVLVPRGDVKLQTIDAHYDLGGPVQLRWSSATGMGEKEAMSGQVAWLDREEQTTAEARAIAILEADLPFDAPVALALVDATTNDRKELRLLGVQALGAIGRLPALIEAINTMNRRDVRQAGIAALRRYLARGEEQEQALRQALLVRFRQSQTIAQGVIDLLRGYSDAEFPTLEKKDYEDLVNLLSQDWELLIRELAIMNLEDLAGKPVGSSYNPDKPKDSDIAAWQRALTDGRLPPKVRGKM